VDRTERFYKIDLLLNERPGVPFVELQARLEVSRATLKRDLAYMKERLNAPIVFDREVGGYRYERIAPQIGAPFVLPGLWFSAEEIHALLTMQHLLLNLDSGGLLGPHIEPLLARLTALLGSADNPADEVMKRIRIESVGARRFHLAHFQAVGSALLGRKRLQITYHARGSDETTEREVSPQRLIHYRDNWYLDAWCHLRSDLRSFAVDAIERAEALEKPAKSVAEATLDATLGAGYGIFSGQRVRWATLRFTPERARWVASERWHPQQEGRFLEDGSYELKVPYSKDPELLMDILKFGADCRVLAPKELQQRVGQELDKMLANCPRPSH
jgi:predicted DNA-binding transcriptional regulator YafY